MKNTAHAADQNEIFQLDGPIEVPTNPGLQTTSMLNH